MFWSSLGYPDFGKTTKISQKCDGKVCRGDTLARNQVFDQLAISHASKVCRL